MLTNKSDSRTLTRIQAVLIFSEQWEITEMTVRAKHARTLIVKVKITTVL